MNPIVTEVRRGVASMSGALTSNRQVEGASTAHQPSSGVIDRVPNELPLIPRPGLTTRRLDRCCSHWTTA